MMRISFSLRDIFSQTQYEEPHETLAKLQFRRHIAVAALTGTSVRMCELMVVQRRVSRVPTLRVVSARVARRADSPTERAGELPRVQYEDNSACHISLSLTLPRPVRAFVRRPVLVRGLAPCHSS
jgi:hypothetical protein